MVKEAEDHLKTKCAICWQLLRPKSPLLHGTKCSRYEIKEKLKLLLPPQDFHTLFDEKIFSNPRLCNLCFVTIRKIPKTISKVQNLIGKTINIQLYKPFRSEWKAEHFDANRKSKTNNSAICSMTNSNSIEENQNSSSCSNEEKSDKSKQRHNGSFNRVESHSKEDAYLESADTLMHTSTLQTTKRVLHDTVARKKDNHLTGENETTVLSKGDSLLLFTLLKQQARESGSVVSGPKMFNGRLSWKERKRRTSRTQESIVNNPVHQSPAISKRKAALRSHNRKLLSETKQSSALESFPDIADSDTECEYLPSYVKQPERPSEDELRGQSKRGQKTVKIMLETTPTSKQLKCTKSSAAKRNTSDGEVSLHGGFNNGKPNLKTDIPLGLSDTSKSELLKLADKVKNSLSSKIQKGKTVFIKCNVDKCDHMYSCWSYIAVHYKFYHHNGQPTGDDDFTQIMSKLADLGQLDKESYPFKCRHRGCELAFTKEDLLKEHKLVHGTDLIYICGFPDCTKAFKVARSLHVHFRSHAKGQTVDCNVLNCVKNGKDSESQLVKYRSLHSELYTEDSYCDQVKNGQGTTAHQSIEKHLLVIYVANSTIMIWVLQGIKERFMALGDQDTTSAHMKAARSRLLKKKNWRFICAVTHQRGNYFVKSVARSSAVSAIWMFITKFISCWAGSWLNIFTITSFGENEQYATKPPVRNIQCEFPGCNKMFTARENMKSHVLNQHRGKKPKSVPGVFFHCKVEGCGKKFTFRSTLYRHNKLVHRGGDYKQGSEFVKYPCAYEGCSLEFNRKNLLEEHMVMEHGKMPKRLLPLQNKELDFIESICAHCGMVLTVTQLPRHEEIYHSEEAIRDSKEISPYMCHLKGCEEMFNAREDRKSHVQHHINNPPFKCQVGDCQETFYLEKNLDNHLWNHSKKASACDFVGCGQVFDDQLQLAKHSKAHYDQKMKCPWPNCDNWLTETGHLKPHFIAHSRTLMANFDLDFVCGICELAFSSNWGLMIHKRMHGEDAAAKPSLSKIAKFTCEESGCQGTFSDQKSFFDHFLYHYTNFPSKCGFPDCTESFKNMITMSRHTKKHYDGKFHCPWRGCDKLFASIFIVKKHLYRHIMSNPAISANRDFQCNQCFMMFRLEQNHQSHTEHHNEKSDHVCPTCGKKGRHNHMKAQRVCKPRKPQVCRECNAWYATVSGLKLHLLQKHKIGKWPFKCNFCEKGFVSSREMQRHIPSHTKEKPFVCSICGTSFASHTGHRAHMRKHAGQKYVCDVEGCGKVYTTATSLRGHKAQHEGFSKTCLYCGKIYKNPYGHKCKASKDKKKIIRQESSQATRPQLSLPVSVLPQTIQPTPHPSHQPIMQVQAPATTSVQHAVIMPQQLVTHNLDMHQVARPIMAAPTLQGHPHLMQHNPNQVFSQGMHHHSMPHQNVMQDRVQQPVSLEINRGNSVDMSGDYTFNNYVVFWDSQNI